MKGRHLPDAANHGGCSVSLDRDDIAEGSSRRRARLSLAADIAISGLTPSDRPPLIVAAPRRKAALSKGLVELVDVYPTLAGLCGLKAPGNLEGVNFTPLLDKPARAWKRAVFTIISRDGVSFQPSKGYSSSNMGRTVFDGRRRYTVWPDDTTELYDYANDPYE
jgi:iduronate 2-sulfatase